MTSALLGEPLTALHTGNAAVLPPVWWVACGMRGVTAEASRDVIIALLGADVAILAAVLVVAALVQTRVALIRPESLAYSEVETRHRIDQLLMMAALQVGMSSCAGLSALVALVWPRVDTQLVGFALTSASILLFAFLSLASIRTMSRLED